MALFLRTGLHAKIGDKIISGCSQCSNNKEFKDLPFFPPTHRCLAKPEMGGKFRPIFDPDNIPDWCIFAFDPKKQNPPGAQS